MCSSSGQFVAAAQFGPSSTSEGYIYISTTYGASWTSSSAPASYWYALACDSTGSILIAGDYYDQNNNGGYIYKYLLTSGIS